MQVIKFTPIPKKARFSLELIRLLADWDQNKIPNEDILNSFLLDVIIKNARILNHAAQ